MDAMRQAPKLVTVFGGSGQIQCDELDVGLLEDLCGGGIGPPLDDQPWSWRGGHLRQSAVTAAPWVSPAQP